MGIKGQIRQSQDRPERSALKTNSESLEYTQGARNGFRYVKIGCEVAFYYTQDQKLTVSKL